MSFVTCLVMQNQAIRRAEVYTGKSNSMEVKKHRFPI